jgi:hypothetical protein
MNLCLLAAGLVAVAALVMMGIDLHRAAVTGPHWKRRLVTAGLVLLAALGLGSCNRAGSTGGTVVSGPVDSTPDLTKSAQWQRLVAAWKDGEVVAAGARGEYPFDDDGKKKLLARIGAAGKDIDALADAHLLSNTEATLLQTELVRLTQSVEAMRTTGERGWSCYLVWGPHVELDESRQRLADRVPLLKKLAVSERLQPQVLQMIIEGAQQELALAATGVVGQEATATPAGDEPQVFSEVRQQIEKLRSRLDEMPAGASRTSGGAK